MRPGDRSDGQFDLRERTKRGRGDVGRCAGQTTKGVFPKPRMVKDAGDYFGMRGLNLECSNAAYEDGGITHDQPRHRVWAKKTGVAPVASSPIQRVRRMSEEIVCSVDNSLAQR